ncbi:hypothetical protein TNCV_5049951 [Trichonephila clavipes]|nr:hypothetical protein TNCV_5049951 [Trichonephila clavipes]
MAYPGYSIRRRGSGSMATTIIRSHTIRFLFPFGPSQGIGVSRCSDFTNALLIFMLFILQWPLHCDVGTHPFHGVLKPASICTVDTLNICLFISLKILLLMCPMRWFFTLHRLCRHSLLDCACAVPWALFMYFQRRI